MRTELAGAHREARDGIAQDWGRFLQWALPEAAWLPVPNLGAGIDRFAGAWGLDGLILTGGEDIGASRLRDETEQALVTWAEQAAVPVFGVCRGLQLLWTLAGGDLVPAVGHVAVPHAIHIADDGPAGLSGERTVSSFHRWKLGPSERAEQRWRALALTCDGDIEAAVVPDRRWCAVMWHPERELPFQDHDRRLVRWTFGHER